LVRAKMKSDLRLTNRHKVDRMAFSTRNMARDWKLVSFVCFISLTIFMHFSHFQVVYSDEKKFNMDGLDGIYYYWRDLRNEARFFLRRNFRGGSVMALPYYGNVE
jgi:hypothetical protein